MAKVIFIGNVLRGFTVFLCIATVVISIFGLISLSPQADVLYNTGNDIGVVPENVAYTICVLCVYLIIASLFIIAIEFQSTALLIPFAVLVSPLGRGIFYIFIGLLVFGLAFILGFLIGILWMIDGVLLIIVGYRSFVVYYEGTGVSDSGTTVVTTTTTTRSGPREVVTTTSPSSSPAPGSTNFCTKCGAKKTPGAKFCTECRTAF